MPDLVGVYMMAGVETPTKPGDYLLPDVNSTNVSVNFESADFFLKKCQSLGVPFTSISRHTVAGCRLPAAALELLRTKGGELGKTIHDESKQSIEELMAAIKQSTLPSRCDTSWFEATFMNGEQYDPSQPVNEQVESLSLFMPVFMLLAVPCIAKRFFEPQLWEVRNVTHQILGISADVSGLKSDMNAELQLLISRLMLKGTVVNQTECDIQPSEVFQLAGLGSFSISDSNPEYMDVNALQAARLEAVQQTGLYRDMVKNSKKRLVLPAVRALSDLISDLDASKCPDSFRKAGCARKMRKSAIAEASGIHPTGAEFEECLQTVEAQMEQMEGLH